MADVILKAVDYLENAGEEALRNYANEEAVDVFGQALSLADEQRSKSAPLRAQLEEGATAQAQISSTPQSASPITSERRACWELKLGQAYINWVKFGEGRAHLEQGLALLGYPLPTTKAGLVASLVGQILQQTLYRLWPARYVGRLSAIGTTLLEGARAYEGLTAVYYFANETMLSLYAAFRSLNLAEAAGPSPELARGYTSVGAIIGFIPLHNLADMYCRRALEASRNIDNYSAQMWVSLGTGMYYAGVGRWTKAQHLFEQVVEIAERLGDRSRWDDGVSNLATLTYFRGEFAHSTKLSDDLYASANRRNDAHNQAWALRSKVYCLLPQGKFAEALTCLETLETLLAQDTHLVDEALRIDLYGLLALVHLRRDEPELALAAADKAINLAAQTSPLSYLSLPGYAGVVETYLSLNPVKDTRAKSNARRASKALQGYARVFPIGQARTYLWRGVSEWLSDRPRRAQKLWAKSLAAAERLAMPYEQGLVHSEIGRRLPLDDPARPEHLTRACEIFTRLEATHDLERAQEALALCTTRH
jgi:tetratricopeptide (TPR) repeat protein